MMPITKKKDGFYWGSKGPFKTRKKAVQVAQAAYASGYVKKSWFSILKKLKWNGTLSEENKKILEREPKLKIDIPKLSYPKEEREIPAILKIMKEKKL